MNFEFPTQKFPLHYSTLGVRCSILKISSDFTTYESRRCLKAEFLLEIF